MYSTSPFTLPFPPFPLLFSACTLEASHLIDDLTQRFCSSVPTLPAALRDTIRHDSVRSALRHLPFPGLNWHVGDPCPLVTGKVTLPISGARVLDQHSSRSSDDRPQSKPPSHASCFFNQSIRLLGFVAFCGTLPCIIIIDPSRSGWVVFLRKVQVTISGGWESRSRRFKPPTPNPILLHSVTIWTRRFCNATTLVQFTVGHRHRLSLPRPLARAWLAGPTHAARPAQNQVLPCSDAILGRSYTARAHATSTPFFRGLLHAHQTRGDCSARELPPRRC